MANIHNVRICRFLILICAVAIMIFFYATYSSSSSLASPHMRAASLVSPSAEVQFEIPLHAQNNNNSRSMHEIININGQNAMNAKNYYAVPQQQQHHYRAPTIDVDAAGGAAQPETAGGSLPADDAANAVATDDNALGIMSNNMLEEQYLQAVDNALGNNSSAHNNNNNNNNNNIDQQGVVQVIDNNKILDSDVLIPTSNFQKFIENADKILKNMTAVPPVVVPETEQKAQPKANVVPEKKQQAPDVAAIAKPAAVAPPSAPAIKSTPKVTPKAAAAVAKSPPAAPAAKPPTKAPSNTVMGIPTKNVYESGHLNEEISIDKICPNNGKDLKLLILIMSAPTHADARLAIRQTWAHFGMRRDVSTAFMLGRTTNTSISNAMTKENFVYGDLIRGNFIDSYNNLTLKTLSSLEWVDVNCKEVKFVLKTDDDMFINVPKLLDFLDRHVKDKRVIYGRLAQKWKPIRNKKSKYYVSPQQYKSALYPPFTTGPAYVLSSDIVHELFTRAMDQLYLKLEDVFTTGVIAQQLNIRRVHVNEFLNRRIAFNACNIRKIISVHMIKANEQYDLWKKLLDQSTKCK